MVELMKIPLKKLENEPHDAFKMLSSIKKFDATTSHWYICVVFENEKVCAFKMLSYIWMEGEDERRGRLLSELASNQRMNYTDFLFSRF